MNELAKTIETIEIKISGVISAMKLQEVKTEDDYNLTAEWLKKAKQTEKYIEEKLEPIRRERYAYYQEVQKAMKKLKEPLVKGAAIIMAQRTKYYRQKEEERLKQQAELLKYAETEKEKLAVVEALTEKKEVGISHYTVYDYIIEDEDKIPQEYIKRIIDDKKIRTVVKSMGLKTNIPGVKVIEKTVERVRV